PRRHQIRSPPTRQKETRRLQQNQGNRKEEPKRRKVRPRQRRSRRRTKEGPVAHHRVPPCPDRRRTACGPTIVAIGPPTATGKSQPRSDLPQLRVEPLAERRAQVLGAGASTRPLLRADLALDHQHVSSTPVRKRLVVVEQPLAQVEEVAKALAIAKDLEQRRRATALHEGAKRVVDRGL